MVGLGPGLRIFAYDGFTEIFYLNKKKNNFYVIMKFLNAHLFALFV